jgi:hypothetical protein
MSITTYSEVKLCIDKHQWYHYIIFLFHIKWLCMKPQHMTIPSPCLLLIECHVSFWNKPFHCHISLKYMIWRIINKIVTVSCSLMYTCTNLLFHGISPTSTRQTKYIHNSICTLLKIHCSPLIRYRGTQKVYISRSIVNYNVNHFDHVIYCFWGDSTFKYYRCA